MYENYIRLPLIDGHAFSLSVENNKLNNDDGSTPTQHTWS